MYKTKTYIALSVLMLATATAPAPASALSFLKDNAASKATAEAVELLAPHKALYDIDLVATRSGSQVINITGQMFYEWQPTCDAWITDHRFSLYYDYADSPSMEISSNFSTFEDFEGEGLNFSARRKRDGDLYEELRGRAVVADKSGVAEFSIPEDLKFDLTADTLFPMAHTVEMIKHARANKKFFHAVVFDGSDDEGPVSINSFIGSVANPMKSLTPSDKLDMSLLNTPAWNVRMAVFPEMKDEAVSDYEMSMVFHENGVISDMLIEYDNFSVTQKLVALEKLKAPRCGAEDKTKEGAEKPKK